MTGSVLTGVGWLAVAVVAVVAIIVLAVLHMRDESIRSIRVGIFLERERTDDPISWRKRGGGNPGQ
jgi:hypothetical protein